MFSYVKHKKHSVTTAKKNELKCENPNFQSEANKTPLIEMIIHYRTYQIKLFYICFFYVHYSCFWLKWERIRVKVKKAQKKLEITGFLTKIPAMKFVLIDKITEFESGLHLKAVKSVSLAEEYLADHFPAFPVLPGVLLLEGLVESASWLVREHQNFANSMVLLESVTNVKYKSFAAPGMQIQYTVTASAIEENTSSFKGVGVCGEEAIVEAKLTLRHFNLADENPKLAHLDGTLVDNLKQRWKLLNNG